MTIISILRERLEAQIALYALLFLFFIQLITDFVEAIYAFGLLGTAIPPEIIAVLLLFTPLILLLFGKSISDRQLIGLGLLMLLSRAGGPLLDTRGQMIVSGIGTGAFLLLTPALLRQMAQEGRRLAGSRLGAGLSISVMLSILIRAASSGIGQPRFVWLTLVEWLLLAMAVLLLISKAWRGDDEEPGHPTKAKSVVVAGGLEVVRISLGLMAILLLLYFAYASPNVIARWTGVDLRLIQIVMVSALVAFAFLFTGQDRARFILTKRLVWAGNVLFLISLTATILAHQIRFPADPSAYPLYEPTTNPIFYLPLLASLILFPIILLDFTLLARRLILIGPSTRLLGASFGTASFFLLLLILAQIFTTVYDYIPVVGPFFRDKFWLVFILPGVALLMSLGTLKLNGDSLRNTGGRRFPLLLLILGISTVLATVVTSPNPSPFDGDGATLRLLTYNIQQGYDANGQQNFSGQLDLMREIDPDVIGLQESDTNRIAGGNSDLVRYFADELDLYSYYGPKVVPGTFGIALLSKYPIQNPNTFYMYSEGEQTASIVAQITVGGEEINLIVTHLGNGGPMVQQEAILHEVNALDKVVLMGDFNFRPESDQYQATVSVLNDAWLLKWRGEASGRTQIPDNRIDHIFVSPAFDIVDAYYLTGPQSDHPAMVAELDYGAP